MATIKVRVCGKVVGDRFTLGMTKDVYLPAPPTVDLRFSLGGECSPRVAEVVYDFEDGYLAYLHDQRTKGSREAAEKQALDAGYRVFDVSERE